MMAEYIEREALIADLGEEPEVWYGEDHEIQARNDWHWFKNMIEAQPAADVVEVVRCKQCQCMFEEGWCSLHNTPMSIEDFCSYGERKE